MICSLVFGYVWVALGSGVAEYNSNMVGAFFFKYLE